MGPRLTLNQTALDDLKILLDIAKRHEPGTYRASGTIYELEKVVEAEMAVSHKAAIGPELRATLLRGHRAIIIASHDPEFRSGVAILARACDAVIDGLMSPETLDRVIGKELCAKLDAETAENQG